MLNRAIFSTCAISMRECESGCGVWGGCAGVCVRVSHVAVGVVGVCVEESIAVECQCGF